MRYVQHLLASTSGRDAAPAIQQGCEVVSSREGASDSVELHFTSQCEHHLLPFQGTIQVSPSLVAASASTQGSKCKTPPALCQLSHAKGEDATGHARITVLITNLIDQLIAHCCSALRDFESWLRTASAVQIVSLPGSSGKKLTHQLAESIARVYSCQLQIQERLTHQIATRLFTDLRAAGVLLLCKASHMCMVARGVEQHASSTVTVAAYGVFESDPVLRRQVVHQLKGVRKATPWLAL